MNGRHAANGRLRADGITIFAVYRRPRDFPDVPFVVRPWQAVPRAGATGRRGDILASAAGPIACLCGTLGEAREGPARLGAYRFDPQRSDDPVLVESWMG